MGNKKNIILLHGWGSSPARWEEVKNLLKADDFTVLAPYLPGFDPKNPLKHPFTIGDYSQWLSDYIDKNKIINPVILGHSHGGRIAIYFGARHPKLIDRLILVDAAGLTPKNTTKRRFFKSVADLGKTVIKPLKAIGVERLFQKLLYKLAGEADYLQASPVMRQTMKNMLSYDAGPDLHKINVPTLIVWGKTDKDTPLWMGLEMAKIIPKAKLELLDTDHNPHRSKPEELVKIIKDFV